jgi:hypothetical protein
MQIQYDFNPSKLVRVQLRMRSKVRNDMLRNRNLTSYPKLIDLNPNESLAVSRVPRSIHRLTHSDKMCKP